MISIIITSIWFLHTEDIFAFFTMASILVAGFVVRFLLPTLFPSIPFKLSSVVELSTPINSWNSLQEAFFYLDHHINPYDGGVNHHPPLLVSFFSFFNRFLGQWFPIFANLLFALVDLLVAIRLVSLNKWYNKHVSARRGEKVAGLSDSLIMSFYLFNPLIILSNLAHCTVLIPVVFFVETLHQLVVNKNLPRLMVSFGIATYLSINHVLLLVPVLALAHSVLQVDELSRIYFQGTALYVMTCGLLVFFSIVLTSSVSFIDQCYGVVIRFDKIQPNLGLWWYFFTEMFEFFTSFYIGVFNLFGFIFIVPITLRFFEFKSPLGDSFLAVFLCYIWMSFLKSYPTVADLGFGVSLAPIFASTVLPYCKIVYITGLTLIVSLVLSPILYYCWIVLGNGNSNFFYSINLIWGGVHIMVLIDFMWGKLVSDYCDEHGIKENRHSIRLTQL